MKKLIIANIMGNGRGTILLEDDVIKEVGFCSDIPKDCEVFDFGNALLVPGFVDIHLHGGDGYDFVDMTKESFDSIRDFHLSHGTTTLCPTLTSCPISKTFEFLEYYKNYANEPVFAGVHLEGPFLSPEMSGAQNLSCLAKPTDELADRLLQYKDIICSVTIAPELENMQNFATKLYQNGILLSAGHSNADAKTLSESKEYGVNKITHMFCATPKRYKVGSFVIGGFEERALIDDGFYVELIADGHHVCKECFEIAKRCKGIDSIIAISDAMRGAGLDNADESYLGEIKPENRVIIEDGVAKLPDRSSFAGSVTYGNKMFYVLCQKYGFGVEKASQMLSENPARYLGLTNVGKIQKGYKADFVVMDKDYNVIKTIKEGKC